MMGNITHIVQPAESYSTIKHLREVTTTEGVDTRLTFHEHPEEVLDSPRVTYMSNYPAVCSVDPGGNIVLCSNIKDSPEAFTPLAITLGELMLILEEQEGIALFPMGRASTLEHVLSTPQKTREIVENRAIRVQRNAKGRYELVDQIAEERMRTVLESDRIDGLIPALWLTITPNQGHDNGLVLQELDSLPILYVIQRTWAKSQSMTITPIALEQGNKISVDFVHLPLPPIENFPDKTQIADLCHKLGMLSMGLLALGLPPGQRGDLEGVYLMGFLAQVRSELYQAGIIFPDKLDEYVNRMVLRYGG